jgi:hypothetical protein
MYLVTISGAWNGASVFEYAFNNKPTLDALKESVSSEKDSAAKKVLARVLNAQESLKKIELRKKMRDKIMKKEGEKNQPYTYYYPYDVEINIKELALRD